jgi:hypothetical protein
MVILGIIYQDFSEHYDDLERIYLGNLMLEERHILMMNQRLLRNCIKIISHLGSFIVLKQSVHHVEWL